MLSFRKPQLQRIAELQDDLLKLAIETGRRAEPGGGHNEKVDKALRDYGKFILHIDPVRMRLT